MNNKQRNSYTSVFSIWFQNQVGGGMFSVLNKSLFGKTTSYFSLHLIATDPPTQKKIHLPPPPPSPLNNLAPINCEEHLLLTLFTTEKNWNFTASLEIDIMFKLFEKGKSNKFCRILIFCNLMVLLILLTRQYCDIRTFDVSSSLDLKI